jgi:hypothetical protein
MLVKRICDIIALVERMSNITLVERIQPAPEHAHATN